MKETSQKLKNIKEYIKDKFNQIQFRIVTVFLALMVTTVIVIIVVNYHENQKAVTKTSLITSRQVGLGVIQNLNGIIDGIQMLTTATTALISSPSEINKNNQAIIDYLISALIQNPLIATIQIAGVNGDLIATSNLTLTNQNQYHFNLTKNLPEGVRYAVTTISRSGTEAIEEWKYLDTDLVAKATENYSPPTTDPRIMPWYTEVASWPRTAWSEPYNIAPNTEGISFSTPIIINDVLVAVVGTNLALEALSKVILNTVVGKTGKAFVLNSSGEIILPQKLSGTMPYIIQEGYSMFLNTNVKNFTLEEQGSSYVIDVFPFPLDVDSSWFIMTGLPLSDFFEPLLESSILSIKISFLILFLASILIFIASGKIAKPLNQLAHDVDKIKDFDFSETTPIKSKIYEISQLSFSMQTMRKVFSSFIKYVPIEVVRNLILEKHDITTKVDRKNITVGFSSVENFLVDIEKFTLEQISVTLPSYFEELKKIIDQSKGVTLKYGDSVMTLWNAPNPLVNHTEIACETALIFKAFQKNYKDKNPFLKELTMFGINTGDVVIGNIGTPERFNYSALGPVVTTASRLQNLNSIYHTSIIISEAVRERLNAQFISRPLDFLTIIDELPPIQIFELMGLSKGEKLDLILTPDQIELSNEFTTAFNLFHAGKIQEAKNQFQALVTKFPTDIPSKIYLSKLEAIK